MSGVGAGHGKLLPHAGAPVHLRIRQAPVLDPRTGLEAPHDILIRDGRIAELGEPGALSAESVPPTTQTIEAAGKHVFPAFVDPHVHLRTPGQEYKENIDTGTLAAAVGGFCQVIAMPNTAPTIDQVSVLAAVVATANEQAHIPMGVLASITVGLQGSELTEMAAL